MPMAAANKFYIRVLIIADFSTYISNCTNNVPSNTIDSDILPCTFLKLSRGHNSAVRSSVAIPFSASTASFSGLPATSTE